MALISVTSAGSPGLPCAIVRAWIDRHSHCARKRQVFSIPFATHVCTFTLSEIAAGDTFNAWTGRYNAHLVRSSCSAYRTSFFFAPTVFDTSMPVPVSKDILNRLDKADAKFNLFCHTLVRLLLRPRRRFCPLDPLNRCLSTLRALYEGFI